MYSLGQLCEWEPERKLQLDLCVALSPAFSPGSAEGPRGFPRVGTGTVLVTKAFSELPLLVRHSVRSRENRISGSPKGRYRVHNPARGLRTHGATPDTREFKQQYGQHASFHYHLGRELDEELSRSRSCAGMSGGGVLAVN